MYVSESRHLAVTSENFVALKFTPYIQKVIELHLSYECLFGVWYCSILVVYGSLSDRVKFLRFVDCCF